jgi:hypothetical protein
MDSFDFWLRAMILVGGVWFCLQDIDAHRWASALFWTSALILNVVYLWP